VFEDDHARADKEAPLWCNPLTLVAGGLLLLHLALKYLPILLSSLNWPQNGGFDATGLALAALAILPWIATHLSSAKLPGVIDLNFKERVERRQDLTEKEIRQLRFIVDGFLTRYEYHHLRNILNGRDARDYELALGLIDYVSSGHGVTEFTKPDGQRRRISEWFKLTSRGEEYMRMRADNERTVASGANIAAVTEAVSLPEAGAVLDRTRVEN